MILAQRNVLMCRMAVQGVYADVYVHHVGGEVQGTRRGEASKVGCFGLLSSSQ